MTTPEKLGKYRIVRELGQGAMGIVYEGFDPAIQRRVALKTIKSANDDPAVAAELATRFQREAQAAGRLTHPHIVGIYELGEDAGTNYIAMEFVEGRELKDYFDANERFPIAQICRIMGELLDALDYSHRQGVVHRDIKPANIILLKDGTVKVADFGIARIEASELTQVGSVLGTPNYMSPEQFLGQVVDGRSDIFAAGILLYEFLTGERPFTGAYATVMHKVLKEAPPLPSELNVSLPPAFDAVVTKAIAKRPGDRFQTASEFKTALLQCLQAQGTEITPVNADDTAKTRLNPAAAVGTARTPTRRVQAFAMTGVLLLFCGGALAWYLMHGGRPTPPPGKNPMAATALGSSPPAAGAPPATDGASPPATGATSAAAGAALPAADYGTVMISAIGLADPDDPRYKNDPATLRQGAREDARRQLIEKAAGLYIQQASLDQNYAVVRDKLLAHNGEFIKTVLEEQSPVLGADGLMLAGLRAAVNVRAVQKMLNQLSTDERIQFIRNNGDPTIAVAVTTHAADAGPDAPGARSEVAENILKEHVRSFGYRVVSDEASGTPPDFSILGDVHFKKLSARLPASGLTIEKFVLTSWTVKAIDRNTGEEIYHNTQIPEKRSWVSEEAALKDVGQLIAEEFNKTFFLQYFHFPVVRAQLDLSGLPDNAATPIFAEIAALPLVLNATIVRRDPAAMTIAAALSRSDGPLGEMISTSVLAPINRKLGRNCLSVTDATAERVQIAFDPGCAGTAMLDQLNKRPPAALFSAPNARRADVVKNPEILRLLAT